MIKISKIFSLGRFVRPYKKHCIFGPIFKFTETILELLMPLILADVIDKGILTGDRQYIFKMTFILILTVIFGFLTATVCQYLAAVAAQGFGTELRSGVFEHISSFSHKEFDRFGTSSLINRVTTDVNNLQYALNMSIRILVRAPFLCVGGFIMALIINVKLALIILITMPLFGIAIYFVMKIAVKLYGKVQKKLDKMLIVINENLSGVRMIRAFARTKGEEKRFETSAKEHSDVSNLAGKISSLLNPITMLIMNVAIIAILWFGGLLAGTGEVTAGKMIALINYVGQILVAVIVVANFVISFSKAIASSGRIDEIFDTKTSIIDGTESVNLASSSVETIVEFNNVNFSYGGGEDDLSSINFKVFRGANVGIIGGTGSGKSTLINLMMRFYDCGSGEVIFDGKNIKDYKIDELHANIALVAQRVELFSGTIEENIKWGNAKATRADVVEACDIAKAREFIEDFDMDYLSPVSRGGANFSGGQKQRLAIARAVVRKAPILILDDSSSALDYATDKALRQALATKMDKGTTIFTVSQRVSTTMAADIIIVLEDGKLAGAGTHMELLKSCGEYVEICSSQSIDIETGKAKGDDFSE